LKILSDFPKDLVILFSTKYVGNIFATKRYDNIFILLSMSIYLKN